MTISTINTVEAKEEFSELLSRVMHNKERIVLVRRGKEVAALIPIEDLALLQSSQDKIDLHEALEALKEARTAGTSTIEQLKMDISKS